MQNFFIEENNQFIIKRQALLNNLKNLGVHKVCAMVKADAYGLGVKGICSILKGRVACFGVAKLSEALEIREFDLMTPILVVGLSNSPVVARDNNISVIVDSLKTLEKYEFKLSTNKSDKKLNVHIKINSGMNRLGVSDLSEFKLMLKFLLKSQYMNLEGIGTHYSTLDCDECFFLRQKSCFECFLKFIPSGLNPQIHVGGGEVVKFLTSEEKTNIMIRVGFRLYTKPNLVMSIKSKIVKIHSLPAFARVGYSNKYITNSPQKIAVIPLGYADGINRKLSENVCVKINDKNCKIIGNVCMDMFFVDVTNVDCIVGDSVDVLTSLNKWSKVCGTIPYEILTSLNYHRMKHIIK